MQPFDRVTGPAAPLLEDDINTDQIAPAIASFKPDYAELLFSRRRRNAEGVEIADFVLNRAPFRKAAILVARNNFGSGSSRESAVWALSGFGIRVVVARSFADIFRENCLKNGLLPISLEPGDAASFEDDVVAADGAKPCTVDLVAQTIAGPGQKNVPLHHCARRTRRAPSRPRRHRSDVGRIAVDPRLGAADKAQTAMATAHSQRRSGAALKQRHPRRV